MLNQTRVRATTIRLGTLLLALVGWLCLGPFILIGWVVGMLALLVRLILAALIEGFERGYRRAEPHS